MPPAAPPAVVETRRRLLTIAPALLLAGCAAAEGVVSGGGKEISPTEDLMREHGVLRRALIVYRETARRLRTGSGTVDAGAIAGTARLFRNFGEDYHERMLEETYVFPTVRDAGGDAAELVPILIDQHRRGREVTAYILSVTQKGSVGTGEATPLARAMDAMARMYEAHAAREDTVVFQAWRKTLSTAQLHELGESFEQIERQRFGGDGFQQAVAAMAQIEAALGIADLSVFDAPEPGGV